MPRIGLLFQELSFSELFLRALLAFVGSLGFGFYVAITFRFVIHFSSHDAGLMGFGSGVAMFIFFGFALYYLDDGF